MESGSRRWTLLAKRRNGKTEYVIHAGDTVVARVANLLDAQKICRAQIELARQALDDACFVVEVPRAFPQQSQQITGESR